MSILEAGLADAAGVQVGSWLPARFTPTLTGTEDFRTEGDKLLRFARTYWSIPDTWPAKLELDEWQEWLLRHVLEVYPDDWPVEHLRGQLRYRQVVISMGRQNGKSVLGALFVLYFLALHVRGPRIIGLASKNDQAKIVYDRVRFGIDKSSALSAELKTTGTRGISRKDGTGFYQTLPAKEESAQGEPASGALYDELHLGLAALWDALILAQRARRNALLVGLTTAGDDNSDLLVRLYLEGEAAIDGSDERFGFFVWEAPDDELTEAGVIAANPAVACGRIPLELAMAEATKMYNDQKKGKDGLTGRQRAIRYTLNRFISGAADSWASTTAWSNTAGAEVEHGDAEVVYSLERTGDWEASSITATSKHGNTYRTELVATINNATADQLLAACKLLALNTPRCVFAMDSTTLKALGRQLKELGYETWILGGEEMVSAAANGNGIIARQAIEHPGDPLVRIQMARGRRRKLPEAWRLSRSLSNGDIDTVVGLVAGLYVATVRGEHVNQLF